ncbi:MAG: family N-acetyltransferase [Nocardioides sp.]|jgi:GNAT superfamily N-acetyltransferase|uniref:GNAT family N-acetyltransferase n=1 Tax=Nocardioides sp. TaxID=35761 RepID=UPI0026038FB9|nr:GNAT family N-acetyltransferase [Nocardioides sp.]MCW2833924.1 family N-acetyltransferase [Nocardioides sp.]
MQLRRARSEEHDALGELTVAAYEEFTGGAEDFYVERLRDVARRDREAEVWVAEDEDGELLGCVTWCPPGSRWREISTPEQGEFRMLAVARTARGRGVGEALIGLCESLSTKTGATEMTISTLESMGAAHRLYERLGYRRAPGLDWDPAPGVHLIAYAKEMS